MSRRLNFSDGHVIKQREKGERQKKIGEILEVVSSHMVAVVAAVGTALLMVVAVVVVIVLLSLAATARIGINEKF